ncbi:MAG: prolipoprotein diacylglyceryl transferase [Planctomycetaceae bacterium]|jgi:phosphatidylglycerol:prolipoprotein diacylglycerol transferase|nr:prolipoprotein diacylglyceryl transferase [Planctomycetaceae bacterium]
MRQTLFYIPTEMKILGIPLLGNGFLFWGIVILVLLRLIWSYWKSSLRSDDYSFAAVMGIVALAVRFLLPKIADAGHGLPIRGYGVFLALAFSLGSAALVYRGRKKWNIPSDTMLSLVLWCVVSGILGARLFYIIEYLPSYLNSPNPLAQALLFYEGGLVVYGGIIGGMIASAVFFWRYRLSLLAMYDLAAPALLLGIAFGRLGCLMNGCCFGAVCDAAYGIVFPAGSPAHHSQVEHNRVFIAGLKFAPSSATTESTSTTILSTTPDTCAEKHDAVDHGGCSCCWIPKRSVSEEEQERINSTPAKIAEVEPESAAEKAGLKSGMIVQRLIVAQNGGQSYETTGDRPFLNVSDLQLSLCRLAANRADAELIFVVTTPENNVSQTIRFPMPPAETLPVYPTQIVSVVGAFCLCLLILFLERFGKRDGFASVLFLFLYSIGRFHIEMFRDDEASFLRTGLSIAQNVSIGMFLLGVIIAIFIYTRPPQHALANRFPAEKPARSPSN